MRQDRADAELTEVGWELVAEHRVVEELAEIFSASGSDKSEYPRRVEVAVLDSLLVRSRSLLDFYWLDLLQSRLFERSAATDAFAVDFFTDDPGMWDAAREPMRALLGPWSTGKRRISLEFLHLTYRRSGQ